MSNTTHERRVEEANRRALWTTRGLLALIVVVLLVGGAIVISWSVL